MKSLKILIGGVCACLISSAQVPEVRPRVANSGGSRRPSHGCAPEAANLRKRRFECRRQ